VSHWYSYKRLIQGLFSLDHINGFNKVKRYFETLSYYIIH
jgi:hypothetical protein